MPIEPGLGAQFKEDAEFVFVGELGVFLALVAILQFLDQVWTADHGCLGRALGDRVCHAPLALDGLRVWRRMEETQGMSDQEESQQIDFEATLAELEALVERMESGRMSLEDSLAAFERGVKLTRQCRSALKSAELRIKALTEDGDELDVVVDDGE